MRTAIDRAILLAVLLALWQGASAYFGAQWVPAPATVAVRFWAVLAKGDLWFHGSYSLASALAGFAIGGIPGVLLPFVLRRAKTLSAILDPYLVAGYGMPKIALAPLFILWFGIGIGSKVALVASIVFFLVFFVTAAGLASVDQRLLAMARVLGASERRIAREIVWPSSVPYILTGFRIAAPYAIGTAVIGELISSNRGLGYLIQLSANDFDAAGAFVGIVALALLVAVLNWGLNLLEAHLLRWRPALGDLGGMAQASF